ncbi:exostosin-2 [Patella vulgata]|uniref:exostosin-2 n=1 Tax=Patella vulgata TaxID=6465 RepID=UPI002180892B|nr:exostosin-2 [Patella vulgata]
MQALRKRHLTSSQSIYFLLLLTTVIIICMMMLMVFVWSPSNFEEDQFRFSRSINTNEIVTIHTTQKIKTLPRDTSCTFHTCLEVYQCGYNDETKISVYVYPIKSFEDENSEELTLSRSKEFDEILQAITDSDFYTSDPNTACLFIPSVDMLNQNNLNLKNVGRVLASLEWWKDGSNHLLFNMVAGSSPDFHSVVEVDTGRAVIAGSGFSSLSYRRIFDVSIPMFNPLVSGLQLPVFSNNHAKKYLLISSQLGLHQEYLQVLRQLHEEDDQFLLLNTCPNHQKPWNYTQRCHNSKIYNYPHVLQNSTFCLVLRGSRLGQPALSDAMQAGCIPVVVADGYVMPFSEVLDWTRAAVEVREDDLADIIKIIKTYSPERIQQMQKQVKYYYDKYFSSLKAIALTTLQIINDRVFPYAGKSYEYWNDIPKSNVVQNPLFLPLSPPKSQGFTAVILTFDRLESLFQVIKRVAKVPSLAKVVVVWNNQNKAAPPMSSWPYIGKPIKVIQTKKNKLSNRFVPYDEIETECILALDDDIIMLTDDEVEFGYEVWREFPDRLVGFPSRLHLWDNSTQKWKYESEWTNEISMVLTGAAFYHKYFSYLYTNSMPGNMKLWVDDHMNCEDIAMNFLMANMTGKAPIKVTPRKKFKCPQCVNNEMLSADLTHMVERSECINKFTSIYDTMPLKSIEFRADPVLYKDNYPGILKKFNDVGSL